VKRKIGILAGLALLGTALYVGDNLSAQQPGGPPQQAPMRIGVVNLIEVMKNYKKAQNMEVELRRLQQEWENKLKPFRDQMNALRAKYTSPGTSPVEKEQIEKEVRKVQIDFSVMEEDAKKDLMKKSGEVYKQIYREVDDAVGRFAGSNGYAAIFAFNDATTPDEKFAPGNVTRKLSLPAAAMPMYVGAGVDVSAIICNNLNAMYPAPGAVPAGPGPGGNR